MSFRNIRIDRPLSPSCEGGEKEGTRDKLGPGDSRPIAFLISTTSYPRGVGGELGSAAYSYHFVVEALRPVLAEFGVLRTVDHPESRLAHAAAKAEAEGFRPVHLAINPLQDVYLSPNLPNVVFPFWEFPEIPSRDLGNDARQNWRRVVRGADLVLTACDFTARAFRRAGTKAPVAVVPIPLLASAFELPDWDPAHSWTLVCRHEVLGSAISHNEEVVADVAPQGRTFLAARAGLRRVAPWLSPATVGRIYAIKGGLSRVKGRNPGKLMFVAAREGYRKHVRRWLSPEALEKVTGAKVRALAMVGREPLAVIDPLSPSGELTLGGGPVYLTILNFGDERKNFRDILTAFLDAFRERPDVTLVIKLVTNRVREHDAMNKLRAAYRSLGVSHRCRVVVITEFLNEEQLTELHRVSAFYVNASHAEGACLPLMRSLAGGRPAIAPDHTAMADYIDDTVAFVPRSHPEPTHWPNDPEKRLETSRYRLVWSDLRDAFLASDRVASRPEEHADLSRACRDRMREYASRDVASTALRAALEKVADRATLGMESVADSPFSVASDL